jgi:hypothetical protein
MKGFKMRFPIDCSKLEFLAVSALEPVTSYDSKEPKLDSDGRAIFQLSVVVLGHGNEGAAIISVKVAGQPKNLVVGSPLTMRDLVLTTWQMGERRGVSFRAESIASAPAKASA